MTVPLPIRTTILQAIQARFTGIDPDAATPVTARNPTGDPIGITWTSVQIGGLLGQDNRKINSMGIVSVREIPNYETYPVINAGWQVNLETRSTHNTGDLIPALIAERSLAAMQRVVSVDGTWGGLAIDTIEIGNEVDIDSYADRSIMVVLMLRITYRRSQFDPRVVI